MINQKVAIWMASFEDPIKSVLGTAVVREQKIIVTRKYVVGGSALITPERAPARTVSIREDAREEVLCRYGGASKVCPNVLSPYPPPPPHCDPNCPLRAGSRGVFG